MNDELTKNQKLFVYWITERWAIKTRRDALLPAPWSDDPIFQETYFTNVDREQDRVTKWIRENWTLNEWTLPNYALGMIIARVFNLPDTLAELGQPEDSMDLWLFTAEDILYNRQENDKRIWNGAYIISTAGRKMSKIDFCLEMFEKARGIDEKLRTVKTLAEAHDKLCEVYGLSDFLAAQVVADLKNTKGHHLANAEDWRTFSAMGPGSKRGLEWFWEESITKKNYPQKIADAMELVEWELPSRIYDVMCMQNFQNCFCEYDKYMRIKNGTGRSKRKYNGR